MIFCSYFVFCSVILVDTLSTFVLSKSECDKCVPPSVNDRYYDYLNRVFNELPSTNLSYFKNQLSKENITLQCQRLRLERAYKISSLQSDNNQFSDLIFRLIGYLSLPLCSKDINQHYKSLNSSWKIWIVGFTCVTVINGCAALGFVFRPLMKKNCYNIIMAFMIAMAVGSLCGSAVLILIPDSFNLAELYKSSSESHIDYKWKATVVFGGVYMFFLVERFLKWIISRKGHRFSKPQHQHHGSINTCRSPKDIIAISNESFDERVGLKNASLLSSQTSGNGKVAHVNSLDANVTGDGIIPLVVVVSNKHKVIAPVAWMIIFGDALHNFIDGLSIGASFSLGVFKGISLSLAVICEELPHELGDFAILLNAGMSIKQALLWNLLSAATCYLGFIVGVILGEMTSSSAWIFAIAGGMFLYISLVDMMPELNAILEKSENEEFGRLKIFLIQNLGLWFGYSIILIMALFGDRISFQ